MSPDASCTHWSHLLATCPWRISPSNYSQRCASVSAHQKARNFGPARVEARNWLAAQRASNKRELPPEKSESPEVMTPSLQVATPGMTYRLRCGSHGLAAVSSFRWGQDARHWNHYASSCAANACAGKCSSCAADATAGSATARTRVESGRGRSRCDVRGAGISRASRGGAAALRGRRRCVSGGRRRIK
jgi:hypothetical protein